ncbi:UDP-N-acetylmuramate--L-alanine ligase [Kandleria vitulina]|uniref:UDP-N-acetylmuramate--L-alanine ligase n=1 Tax=Kandleria vitulina TaxID=1630 RepID=UPI0008B2CE48|nr:Mur ligase family protein [Kandleria vitulina]SEJ05559.1 UDP-N-acetylmuramate--L-alanine ligase [Kandleria vitulina]
MYYFVGIKGSGMASLAEILHDLGHEVAGSDIDKYIFIEEELKRRGIPIYSWNKNNIKDGMHVITGNDFDRSNPEVAAAQDNPNVICQNYCEFLGDFFNNFISIGIGGTHGKTTTTGMCYHLFKDYDKTNVLIGDGTGYAVKDAKYFVSEVDEFRNHFKHYYNDYALINNVEYDHVDYFKTFEDYKKVFEEYGNRAKKMAVIWGDDPYLPHMNWTKPVCKFGLNDNNDIQAKNVINNDKGLSFDVYAHGELFGHFALPFYGMHTLYDTLAVITLGYLEGMDAEYMQKQLSTFEGVKRRYTVKEKGDCIFVDDYAHHPTAVQYVLEETRTRYPGKQIIAVFQPDRFSRALRFAKRFAAAMDLADHPFFLDFPDNAHPEPGIDIDVTEITQYIPRAKIVKTDKEHAKMLAAYDNAVYVFMSSKDIYKLEELVIEAKG